MDTNEGKGRFVAGDGRLFEKQKFDEEKRYDGGLLPSSSCFPISSLYSVSIAVTTALSSAHRILRASASVCLAVRGRSRLAVRPVENLS